MLRPGFFRKSCGHLGLDYGKDAATRRFEASAWIRSWLAAKWHRDALASFGAQGTLALTKTGLPNRLATACALVAAAWAALVSFPPRRRGRAAGLCSGLVE